MHSVQLVLLTLRIRRSLILALVVYHTHANKSARACYASSMKEVKENTTVLIQVTIVDISSCNCSYTTRLNRHMLHVYVYREVHLHKFSVILHTTVIVALYLSIKNLYACTFLVK